MRALVALATVLMGCSGKPGIVRNAHLGEAPEEPAAYRIEYGDQLAVRFAGASQLSSDVRVRPDGRVSLPYVGEVPVSGKTTEEVHGDLEDRYGAVLKNAELSVSLVDFQPPVIYMAGEVTRPGAYPMGADLTLMRAVTEAGGFTSAAARSRVLVIRNTGAELNQAWEIDLEKVLMARDGAVDPFLRADDVIVIPDSRVAAAGRAIDHYINDLLPDVVERGLSIAIGTVAADEVRRLREESE